MPQKPREIAGRSTEMVCGYHWAESCRVDQISLESYAASELDAIGYAKLCAEIAQCPDEVNRRSMVARRRAILEDAWKPELIASMKSRVRKELWEPILGSENQFADISRNPAKTIWEEMAQLYKRPPRRTSETPGAADAYLDHTRWTAFNLFWSGVEIQLAAFNDLLIYPTTTKDIRGNKVIEHNVLAGDTVTVILDAELAEADKPAAVVLLNSVRSPKRGEDQKTLIYRACVVYTVVTPDWIIHVNDKGEIVTAAGVPIEGTDEEIANQHQQIPFVFIHKTPHSQDFWQSTLEEDLVALTLKLGRWNTDDDYARYRSNHKQIAITGDMDRQQPQQISDSAAVLRFYGKDLDLELLDWQLDLTAAQEVSNGEEIRAGASRGINEERIRRTAYQTTEAAKLSERGLGDRRARMIDVFRPAEDAYYVLVSRLLKLEGMTPALDPKARIEVIYASLEYPTDPSALLALDERAVRMGLKDILDIILAEHPDWTEARAKEQMRINTERLVEVQAIKQAAGVPENDLGNRSAADEINGAKGPIARDGEPTVSSTDISDEGEPSDAA